MSALLHQLRASVELEKRKAGHFARLIPPMTFAQRRQKAWERFVADYTGCVDADPGDARRRFFAAIEAIDAEEGK